MDGGELKTAQLADWAGAENIPSGPFFVRASWSAWSEARDLRILSGVSVQAASEEEIVDVAF